MRLKIYTLIFLSFCLFPDLFAQKVIPLKEVNVYPIGYVKEVLEKVNIALATNYETKKYFKYHLSTKTEAGKNQVLERLETTTPIKTNPLVFAYYFSKGNTRPQIIDSAFYKLHQPNRVPSMLFHNNLITALDLERKDILKYNEKYEYQVERVGEVININFKSEYYCGNIKVNTTNFNLISLDYYNDKLFKTSTKFFNNGDKNDIITIITSSNYITCSLKFKPLKNNKFVIDSLKFDVEYQNYTIINLKNPTIKPVIFKKIESSISMALN